MAGWGDVALPGTVDGSFSWYFWVPILGPLVGGIIGVFVYDWFIGDILHARAGLVEPVGRTRDDDRLPQHLRRRVAPAAYSPVARRGNTLAVRPVN